MANLVEEGWNINMTCFYTVDDRIVPYHRVVEIRLKGSEEATMDTLKGNVLPDFYIVVADGTIAGINVEQYCTFFNKPSIYLKSFELEGPKIFINDWAAML